MTREEVEEICKYLYIDNYTINDDFSIDVREVDISEMDILGRLPIKFRRIEYIFACVENKLTTLDGSPNYVGSNFSCSNNKLMSLIGGPEHVGESYWCRYNLLTSFIGSPNYIGGNFLCQGNGILDFEGFPKHVGGNINLENNPIYEVWRLFKNRNDIEFFNDCDPIRGDSIVLDRLNFFLEETGKPTVTGVKGYKMI